LKEDTYRHFSTTREIEVIPNFIPRQEDYKKPDAASRARYALPEEPILCHISNFRKVKRVEDVLQTFSLINDKIPSRILLVGDGPERYKLEELCAKLDLCDRVKFLGKITDTLGVLSMSDLFILPSETESFGLVALEAMAVGVPVISSNTGGIPEVNVHGVSGYLSNVGDVEDMAQNGVKLLSDDNVLMTFRKNAQERAREFDLDSIVAKYEAVYESLK
jgi:N-acetyl-alpha-D-glucosaminyl L-malate synthase BshA